MSTMPPDEFHGSSANEPCQPPVDRPYRPSAGLGYRTPLLIGILLGLLGGYLLTKYIREGFGAGANAQPRPVTPRGDLAPEEKTTMEIFDRASPSVVYITSLAQRRDFFGLNVFEVPQGTGSGFIWDKDGHIVTNFHVIMDANAVKVTLPDHTSWEAKLVGADPSKDLAVLQVSAPPRDLQPILVGTSKDLRVGQKVFAIGNPFGLDYTLTTGIVSALGRTISSFYNRTIDGVIQTDAAINPGNSGGPLLDSAGRLIGVTTQIASPSGASAGIGFAVPVDIVNRVVPQIIEHGQVIRPALGLRLWDDTMAQRLNVEGVIIRAIIQGGAAERAGLRGTTVNDNEQTIEWGDIITAIDDQPVKSQNDLLGALEKHKVGDTVTVHYLRDGKPRTADVTLSAP
jgi:S1-C subfamily serine protease